MNQSPTHACSYPFMCQCISLKHTQVVNFPFIHSFIYSHIQILTNYMHITSTNCLRFQHKRHFGDALPSQSHRLILMKPKQKPDINQ